MLAAGQRGRSSWPDAHGQINKEWAEREFPPFSQCCEVFTDSRLKRRKVFMSGRPAFFDVYHLGLYGAVFLYFLFKLLSTHGGEICTCQVYEPFENRAHIRVLPFSISRDEVLDPA